jgi:hypothetical protein
MQQGLRGLTRRNEYLIDLPEHHRVVPRMGYVANPAVSDGVGIVRQSRTAGFMIEVPADPGEAVSGP